MGFDSVILTDFSRLLGRPLRRLLVSRLLERVQEEAQVQPLIVVLFGGGGRRLSHRRKLAEMLRMHGFTALVPEDDFQSRSPSIAEIAYLREKIFDLALIFPESFGSATEFGQFLEIPIIAPKMVVLVPQRYHPIYGGRSGYLSDAYMKHLAKYGHVYAYNDSGRSAFPRSSEIILKLCRTRRDLKLFTSNSQSSRL